MPHFGHETACRKKGAVRDTLPINVNVFSLGELHVVVKKLKFGKAPGADGIHPEFRDIVSRDQDACGICLQLCQKCWGEKNIRSEWRLARVRLPNKQKRRYKVLAALIQQRLLDGGCEGRMRHAQSGARPKRATGDALRIT